MRRSVCPHAPAQWYRYYGKRRSVTSEPAYAGWRALVERNALPALLCVDRACAALYERHAFVVAAAVCVVAAASATRARDACRPAAIAAAVCLAAHAEPLRTPTPPPPPSPQPARSPLPAAVPPRDDADAAFLAILDKPDEPPGLSQLPSTAVPLPAPRSPTPIPAAAAPVCVLVTALTDEVRGHERTRAALQAAQSDAARLAAQLRDAEDTIAALRGAMRILRADGAPAVADEASGDEDAATPLTEQEQADCVPAACVPAAAAAPEEKGAAVDSEACSEADARQGWTLVHIDRTTEVQTADLLHSDMFVVVLEDRADGADAADAVLARTSVKRMTLRPVWREAFMLAVRGDLVFQVRSSSYGTRGGGELLGAGRLRLGAVADGAEAQHEVPLMMRASAAKAASGEKSPQRKVGTLLVTTASCGGPSPPCGGRSCGPRKGFAQRQFQREKQEVLAAIDTLAPQLESGAVDADDLAVML